MSKNTAKIYCYVDETEQDTGGKLFLVAVIQKHKGELQALREQLVLIESSSGKSMLKWKKTSFKIKQDYLLELAKLPELHRSIYYSKYLDSKEYIRFVSLTVAKALNATMTIDYSSYVVVDALNARDESRVKTELKRLGIKYRTVRGMKDEQEPLLRLADALAGFIRDYEEGQDYTKHYFNLFKKAHIIREI